MKPRFAFVQSCALILLVSAAGHARPDEGERDRTQSQPPLTSRPDRAAFMRQHFAAVLVMHDAVIRGDLKTARQQARTLADRPSPQDLPAGATPYLASMQSAAAGAATAVELDDVANAAASMLATCGDCHRAVGTMPAHARPSSPVVGGAVGHMLAHKEAVDLMVQGLTVPSASLWQQGAETLGDAPLRRAALPRDPKLTKDVLASEEWVHQLADRARHASDQRSRIYVYSELIQSCGTCHALRGNVWGPDKK